MQKRLLKTKLVFVILALTICSTQIVFAGDTVSHTVVISAEVVPSVVPVPPPINNSSGSVIMPTIVNFSGVSNPNTVVYILTDGQMSVATVADKEGKFKTTITGLNTNSYNFSIYAEDTDKSKSSFVSMPIYVTKGNTINVSNIYLVFTEKPEVATDGGCSRLIGDLNCDNHVNYIDFTLLSIWYRKSEVPPKKYDLNNDGVITLVDFSIMMFNWTD